MRSYSCMAKFFFLNVLCVENFYLPFCFVSFR